MKKSKVIVTGAAGQVGSELIKKMTKNEDLIPIALCRNEVSAGMIKYIAPECMVRVGSISDDTSTEKIMGDADILINCALASVSGNPKKSLELNNKIIKNISRIDNLKLVIHLSSISVYGGYINPKKSSFKRPTPDSDYGRTKFTTEQLAKKLFIKKGLGHYILRLGHVYGANTDRSKQIIDLAKNRDFRLPFNGNKPSNAIHIEKLAKKIIDLIHKPINFGIYNIAEKNNTWRKNFDWHTDTIGIEKVKTMSQKESENMLKEANKNRIPYDILRWAKKLPITDLVKAPSVFDLAFRMLYIIPENIKELMVTKYKCMDVKKQINEIKKNNIQISPVYFSEAMPGPYVEFENEKDKNENYDEKLNKQLIHWHKRFSEIDYQVKNVN